MNDFFRFFLYILFISFLWISACQGPPAKIEIKSNNDEIYCGQQASVQTKLYDQGKSYAATQDDFKYTAQLGSFEGNIYQAPEEPGEDTISIRHLPSQTQKQIKVKVIQGPMISVSTAYKSLACGQNLGLNPEVFIGAEKQPTKTEEYRFQCEKGKFEGLIYHAPDYETTDNITICYPALKLSKTISLEIKATAILSLDLQSSIFCLQELAVTPYFNKLGKHLPIAPEELEFSAERGSFKGHIYQAPKQAGKDTLTIVHKASRESLERTIEIKKNIQLKLTALKKELLCYEKMQIVPVLIEAGKTKKTKPADYTFKVEKGKFEGNIYQAPSEAGTAKIIVTHAPSGTTAQLVLNIKPSKFRPIETDHFVAKIPSDWSVFATDMGFIANTSQGQYKWGQNVPEIKGLSLAGFDFLNPRTIMVLFQQQGGMKHMEKIKEDNIELDGFSANRIIFERTTESEYRSWWIIFKREKIVYLFTISGPHSFFDNSDVPQQALDNFKFKQKEMQEAVRLKMGQEKKLVEEPFFSVKLPQTWRVGSIFGMLFASSQANVDGERIGFFILGYRSREMESIEPALILLLFRQEIVKDPNMQVSGERDIEFAGTEAKMLEFIGGQNTEKKLWIIAAKHNFTGYAIIFNGPTAIWDANPKFAEKILQSFSPK